MKVQEKLKLSQITQKQLAINTLVKKWRRLLFTKTEETGILFTAHVNLWTKGQIYESPHGQMLSSTKTTVIPWRVFRIPELRSQKSLWSPTCQYSGYSYWTFLQWWETLVKRKQCLHSLNRSNQHGGVELTSLDTHPGLMLQSRTVCALTPQDNSYAWVLFLGY